MFTLMPAGSLAEQDVQRGMKWLVLDGICSQTMGVLVGGAFLVQFALLLGASNAVIGFVAAVGPLTQILQIPAVVITERTRMRKATTVVSVLIGRVALLLVAAVPFLVPERFRVAVFLGGLLVYYGLGAIAGCAWNSWMRDLIPQEVMGRYFSRRLAIATAVGAGLSLAAALGLGAFKAAMPSEIAGYSAIFVVGIAAGLIGTIFLTLTPEPRMEPVESHGIMASLSQPLRDANFRNLLVFMGFWSFSVNLAAPFFTVYLLKRLGFSMTWVIALAVLSQAVNVFFFRVWGRIADKFANKPALGAAGFMFILSILVWPFTANPNMRFLAIPLVLLVHVMGGISTAGMAVCGGNIVLKLAPRGHATSYLAVNGLVCGMAATLAPAIAGLAADSLESHRLRLGIDWLTTSGEFRFSAVHLQGLDFVFVAAFLLGLYSLHRLLAVREEGEVEERVVFAELYAEMRAKIRHVSNVAGMRNLTYFPYQLLKSARGAEPAKPAEGRP